MPLEFESDAEYLEFFSLFFNPSVQKKAVAFLMEKKPSNMDHIFKFATDPNENNLMHLNIP